jgi:hypothetical protein
MSESFFFASFSEDLQRLKEHRITVLLFVLYESETWSLTLQEEYKESVFEIFGPVREEVKGDWNTFIMKKFMISCAP